MFIKNRKSEFFKSQVLQRKIAQANKTITIGLMGTSKGVGVTHISLLIGEYFSKQKGRVAIVEWGLGNSFKNLYETVYGDQNYGDEEFFAINKTHYYIQYQGEGLSDLKKDNYQVVIVDFGEYSLKRMNMFNELDIQILVGRGDDWNYLDLIETVSRIPDNEVNGWKVIIPHGTPIMKRVISKHTGLRTYNLPYCSPFDMNKECTLVINQVLGV